MPSNSFLFFIWLFLILNSDTARKYLSKELHSVSGKVKEKCAFTFFKARKFFHFTFSFMAKDVIGNCMPPTVYDDCGSLGYMETFCFTNLLLHGLFSLFFFFDLASHLKKSINE